MIKTRPRKTVEDFMRLPEGTLAELIEGEICMSPSPRVRHQRIVSNLHRLLAEPVRSGKTGPLFVARLDVPPPSGDVVEPDLMYVSHSRASILQDWIQGVPDLLIEVVSPTFPGVSLSVGAVLE